MKSGWIWLVVLVLCIPTLAEGKQGTAVVVKPVEELTIGEPVVVNGEIRARYDITLPSTVDGRLEWVLEEGTVVTKGMVVAKVDDRQLRLQKKEQRLLADRAAINLRYLQGEVDRLSGLVRSSLASQTQLADMTSRRDLAANDIAVSQARIEALEETISRTRIASPVDGVVIRRLRQGGEYARAGEGVLRIVNPNTLEVVVSAPLSRFDRIDAGQAVTVSLDDLKFNGTLRAIMRAGDPSSQTFRGIVDVPGELTHLIVAGQFAEVHIPLSGERRSLFVPRDAIVLRSEGTYVYRIGQDNVAQRVAVTLGAGQGDLVAVSGKLSVGDSVAVRGVERLADGQSVMPVSG